MIDERARQAKLRQLQEDLRYLIGGSPLLATVGVDRHIDRNAAIDMTAQRISALSRMGMMNEMEIKQYRDQLYSSMTGTERLYVQQLKLELQGDLIKAAMYEDALIVLGEYQERWK